MSFCSAIFLAAAGKISPEANVASLMQTEKARTSGCLRPLGNGRVFEHCRSQQVIHTEITCGNHSDHSATIFQVASRFLGFF